MVFNATINNISTILWQQFYWWRKQEYPVKTTDLYGNWIYNYLPVQSVPITTDVVSSNPTHGKVYQMEHYVIKFVNDLRQVSGFHWILLFPPPIKLLPQYS
jgi:hypothetical protein